MVAGSYPRKGGAMTMRLSMSDRRLLALACRCLCDLGIVWYVADADEDRIVRLRCVVLPPLWERHTCAEWAALGESVSWDLETETGIRPIDLQFNGLSDRCSLAPTSLVATY